MKAIFILLALAALTGCATQQMTTIPLSQDRLAAKPADAPIEVFQDTLPNRPYREISRLNIHLEKTHLIGSNTEKAIEQLKQQARACGADAIIEVTEDRGRLNETRILNVSATAIVYTD